MSTTNKHVREVPSLVMHMHCYMLLSFTVGSHVLIGVECKNICVPLSLVKIKVEYFSTALGH